MLRLISKLLLVASVLQGAFSHPDTVSEIAAREVHALKSRDLLNRCKRSFIENTKLHADRLRKREEFVNEFVKLRGIERRNTTPYHKRGISGESMFAEIACVLTPQTTIGPYYVKSTHRADVRENQPGIPLLLDIQFVDVNNCQPVPGLYVDIWQANATGIYGGVQAEKTVGQTYLRGFEKVDDQGILHMTAVFPGWYTNRAVHTHILAHKGSRLNGNQISGGTVPHIGQLFWDMNLINQVKGQSPYNTNRMVLLPNQQDFIFQGASRQTNALMTSEFVGGRLTDGIISTITIGINPNYHNSDTGFPGLPNPTAR
ncbi:aromatic compound dioxygenase [Ascobolus immersus RN42]|uniref:Aromatic compound dioxygenase n=1 Tax=Ascobolus immersus RN42 TaxID=1160509 RepID=A0A3N4IBG5_ASCIM|nr:aromatic compound dioxygenase [Ascobolus immersus RN42]